MKALQRKVFGENATLNKVMLIDIKRGGSVKQLRNLRNQHL
ncbi:hypothetical protein [Chroococcidiopsis thermalis]|nr:hypothetical protein [Chroococcidiopsis thermalis]